MVPVIKAHSRKGSMCGQVHRNSLLSRMQYGHGGHSLMGMEAVEKGGSWERGVWKENLRLRRGSHWPGDGGAGLEVGDTAKNLERRRMTGDKS